MAEGAELRGAGESGRRGFVLHQRRRLEGLRFPRGSQLPGARGNGEQPAALRRGVPGPAGEGGEVFLGRFAQKAALCRASAPYGASASCCVCLTKPPAPHSARKR